jgi:hypothetical protein
MRETISVSNKIRCSKSETTRVGCRGEDHSSLDASCSLVTHHFLTEGNRGNRAFKKISPLTLFAPVHLHLTPRRGTWFRVSGISSLVPHHSTLWCPPTLLLTSSSRSSHRTIVPICVGNSYFGVNILGRRNATSLYTDSSMMFR